MSKTQATLIAVFIGTLAVFLWFIQGFYFVLNDKSYHGNGVGIAFLMVCEAVVAFAVLMFTTEHIVKMPNDQSK